MKKVITAILISVMLLQVNSIALASSGSFGARSDTVYGDWVSDGDWKLSQMTISGYGDKTISVPNENSTANLRYAVSYAVGASGIRNLDSNNSYAPYINNTKLILAIKQFPSDLHFFNIQQVGNESSSRDPNIENWLFTAFQNAAAVISGQPWIAVLPLGFIKETSSYSVTTSNGGKTKTINYNGAPLAGGVLFELQTYADVTAGAHITDATGKADTLVTHMPVVPHKFDELSEREIYDKMDKGIVDNKGNIIKQDAVNILSYPTTGYIDTLQATVTLKTTIEF